MWGANGAPARAVGRRARRLSALTVMLMLCLVSGCSASSSPSSGLPDPASSVAPSPNYPNVCAPVGADTSTTCLRVTLQAIDRARSGEGLAPMVLPSNFPRLTVAEQVFVVIDRERVDRGLSPFTGLTVTLDRDAQQAADAADLPRLPGPAYESVATEWIGAVDNGLDADYQWMYDDGPDAGVPGCRGRQKAGCWADRRIILSRMGSRHLVMGAAFNPSSDMSPGDRGGSSLSATLAIGPSGAGFAYTWQQALVATMAGTLPPLTSVPSDESLTGIRDPERNIAPAPNYPQACAANGIDDSPRCIDATLDAINHAHALEGVRPMVLPFGFAHLSIPQQLFVAVNLERVDRSLPPFEGLTAALDQNAQRGANDADDPPDPGAGYALDDAEWAGGSSNGLDAVYGWMYDDGFESGNLDCTRRGAAGCWGHRKGILDDFGSGPNLAMGAAIDTSGDTHEGDDGGTSMAVTLAVADAPVRVFTYGWQHALAAWLPGAAP